MNTLLVANRGEIAIRVLRAASELGLRTLAVHTADDVDSLHTRFADEVRVLPGSGPAGYLDIDALLAIAADVGCDAVHPGYGFLSESATFARRCEAEGLRFVGPAAATLDLLGDKAAARALAQSADVPVTRGSDGVVALDEARRIFGSLPAGSAMLVKAVRGGGGRGISLIRSDDDLAAAMEQCRSEAERAFGDGALYCEEFLENVRHIEVQVAGDAAGEVVHFGERECSVQRKRQKLIEVTPAPHLPEAVRDRLHSTAVRLAQAANLVNVATIEFLVKVDDPQDFVFVEANPRLQVEHTITEEVTGVDLVKLQLRLAAGEELATLLPQPARGSVPQGVAMQVRVNAERMDAGGEVRPATGRLRTFTPPSGPGVRTDSAAYTGWSVNPRYDSLLAKVVVHVGEPDFELLVLRTQRALSEFHVRGLDTNLGFLQNIVAHPELMTGRLTTMFVDEHRADLLTAPDPYHVFPGGPEEGRGAGAEQGTAPHAGSDQAGPAPLADHLHAVTAPSRGTVVSIDVAVGDEVAAGAGVAVLEAMKMEQVACANRSGIVREVRAAPGETVEAGSLLVVLEPTAEDMAVIGEQIETDPNHIRADLAEVLERHEQLRDTARPEAVARRRRQGRLMARENVDAVVDPDSFIEYGSLTLAAQRARHTEEGLARRSPADGIITGVGTINADLFGSAASRAVVLAYDYSVMAGTQGKQGHRKKDRMFELAEEWRLPVVLFAEGGGGRPGETEGLGIADLDTMAFALMGKLSGTVPLVGVAAGRCFAGNAALLACCDTIIATEDSNIGMGGPAMIEGGGLGVFEPEDIGPIEVQRANGVVDVVVADEAEAAATARKYLGYFQGSTDLWEAPDQRNLRHVIPENRLRAYDIRRAIDGLIDVGSGLELRRDFGTGIVTTLARIEGRPVGILANAPTHLGGAIDAAAADKAARFMRLCDAFGLPLVSLCDTPGFMVGPAAEETATVRHFGRLFVIGANLRVPHFNVLLRKAYGLGAQAMCGGSLKTSVFTVAWPTGEFGAMGIEGAVRLGYRAELEAEQDPQRREELFNELVDDMYRTGRALNVATHFEFDDVIDPAETRSWLVRGLETTHAANTDRGDATHTFVDTW